MHSAWVYILTNDRKTVLYVGATTAIATRHWEHITKQNPKSFTARYNVFRLVYVEWFETFDDALQREKVLKRKPRKWKEQLITSKNSQWEDLSYLIRLL